MSLEVEARESDSPFIEQVMHGYTFGQGQTVRPAEVHWHMVLRKVEDQWRTLVVGPLRTSGLARWGAGAEIIWIKFKLGTFMPRMPTRYHLDLETELPDATGHSF